MVEVLSAIPMSTARLPSIVTPIYNAKNDTVADRTSNVRIVNIPGIHPVIINR